MKATKVFISKSQNPFYNLSLEDWALSNLDTSETNYLILYRNRPSVIIGRNQNIFEEVNIPYCLNNGIDVARRISGGGTVFHDEGNLNWTHIVAYDSKKVNAYDWAAKFIIDLLKGYGLKAYLNSRNAIEVDGEKLSGQAQFTNRKNILSHGTLLVSSRLDYLQEAIDIPDGLEISSKASKSVRSKTANMNSFLTKEITIEALLADIVSSDLIETIQLDPDGLSTEKLISRDWIYGRSPKFIAKHMLKGELISMEVRKAKVVTVRNEMGHLIKDSPFLNQTYEKVLLNYSL